MSLDLMFLSLFSQLVWAKKAVVLQVVTSSIMDQFKEIPLLECLLNFRKDVFY